MYFIDYFDHFINDLKKYSAFFIDNRSLS